MPYSVQLSSHAERQLDRIPDSDAERILKALRQLGEDPRPRGVKKLHGRLDGWRMRVGDYRIVYAVFDPDRLVFVNDIVRRTTTTY